MRYANDESVRELLRYMVGDKSDRLGVLVNEVDENGDIDGLKENVTDLYRLDDRFYVEYVGQGTTAYVWYVRDIVGRCSYALKTAHLGKTLRDGLVLRDLLGLGLVADVYAYDDRFVLMSYVEGDLVSDMDEYELEDRDYMEHMRVMLEDIYNAGYVAMDVHNDNVKYDEGSWWIVDVGHFVKRTETSTELDDVIIDFEETHRLY